MKTKNPVTKSCSAVGIEAGSLITSDSKSNTLLSELVRHVLLRRSLKLLFMCNVVCFWPSAMKKSQMQYFNIKIVYSFGIYSRIGN